MTSNVSSVTLLFQNKVMLLLKIMLIYDEALLSGQPPLSGHLPCSNYIVRDLTATITGTSKNISFNPLNPKIKL